MAAAALPPDVLRVLAGLVSLRRCEGKQLLPTVQGVEPGAWCQRESRGDGLHGCDANGDCACPCQQIYADPAKRLELYFRPKDPYCHPVCANRFPTSTMLLKVKRRTKKKKQFDNEEQIQPEVHFEMEILGIVTTVYKFQGNTWICVHVA